MGPFALIFPKQEDALSVQRLITARYKDARVQILHTNVGLMELLVERPELLIIDTSIFDPSGFDIARVVKLDERLRDVAIIFLVPNNISPVLKEYFLEFERVEFVTKPIDGYELLNSISLFVQAAQDGSKLSNTEIQDAVAELACGVSKDATIVLEGERIVESNDLAKSIFMDALVPNISLFELLPSLKLDETCNSIPKLIRLTSVQERIRVEHNTPKGQLILKLDARPFPIFDDGVLLTIEDITESEKEALKQKREQEAQEAIAIHQSKMASMGEMMGIILHQWKQPLNTISVIVQMMDEYANDDGYVSLSDIKTIQAQIKKQIDLMSETSKLFKNFLSPSTQKSRFVACEAVNEIVGMVLPLLKVEDIKLEISEHGHFCVYGYKSELMHAVLNIISNAKDAMVERGIKEGKIDILISSDSKVGSIAIRDNAGGIPQELLPNKLFEKYRTTKGDKGTGIGLNLAKNIIEDRHSGKLTARNWEEGAEFVIELPIMEGQQ